MRLKVSILLQPQKDRVSFILRQVYITEQALGDMECSINLSYIREIVGEDPVMLKEFITDIVNQMEETDHLLQQYIQNRDLDGLAKTAHRLKSSLQVIGATPLASKLSELETLATNAQLPQEIISLYKVIEVLSDHCKAKLKKEL